MKYLITLLALACLWCTSCSSTYQYVTIGSAISNESSEGFVTENDTVKIVYAFNGENGPVQVSLYNKLQIPIYVDWDQSALIVNNDRRIYSNKKSAIDAQLNSTASPSFGSVNAPGMNRNSTWMNSTTQTGMLQGTITSQEPSSFIPPQSWARESQLTLRSDFFELPVKSTAEDVKKVNGVSVNTFTYSQEKSPLKLRSFLTLSTQPDFSKPFYVNHEFWVSEISHTKLSPGKFPAQASQFYIRKINYAGAFVLAGVGAAAIVGSMALIYSQAAL